MSDDIVLFTGGFDPIHSGHILAIKEASKFGRVIIGLNSDEWLTRKKGKPFMSFEERRIIMDQIKGVMCVIDFDDSDNTAVDAINKAKTLFPKNKIIFINGGDRNSSNIPEEDVFKNDVKVVFKYDVGGGTKKNSSSWILKDWKSPQTKRIWGEFLNYYESSNVKIKRLILEPGKSISMQYHEKRSEFWFIESGIGDVYTLNDNQDEIVMKTLNKHKSYEVLPKQWHKLKNIGHEDLCVIEIQYGDLCSEEDIVRK